MPPIAQRGLVFYRVLELAAAHDSICSQDLIFNPRPNAKPPGPLGTRGHPARIEGPPANRRWGASPGPTPARWIDERGA